ncbi:hypothetical protein KSP40_PGU013592 [Platanthera guangdongensis]|uniref:Uncharacterized protein n=1 Tax=Platanthera guangdongensis TaxID=2320717 RepID=A0ABR2MYT6_9ASPA
MTSTNRATASRLSSSPTTSRSAPLRRRGENHGRRRRNPLNSGCGFSIELLANPSQSAQCRHEHPRAPLFTWLIGYTIGCVAILPIFVGATSIGFAIQPARRENAQSHPHTSPGGGAGSKEASEWAARRWRAVRTVADLGPEVRRSAMISPSGAAEDVSGDYGSR